MRLLSFQKRDLGRFLHLLFRGKRGVSFAAVSDRSFSYVPSSDLPGSVHQPHGRTVSEPSGGDLDPETTHLCWRVAESDSVKVLLSDV